MKELMQKALTALSQRKEVSTGRQSGGNGSKAAEPQVAEDWGMSPEDALKVGTVARYK
ncbi:hypothetical protein SAMN04488073_0812 [Marinobacter gudaonensis]|uniref:Uncharacterized protein n=1 Tax=Marinobacter gudaonensis TaxID=375760 RepID=A0A1I6GHB4_9GAMM|nr:hypothetical protein [Marinobacter gudaonensis]SFR41568.1 hypothetical protein SAMN04488073_0812 [Marinobacter gudaonensis]